MGTIQIQNLINILFKLILFRFKLLRLTGESVDSVLRTGLILYNAEPLLQGAECPQLQMPSEWLRMLSTLQI